MSAGPEEQYRRGSLKSAFVWTLSLSVLLAWLPFFGPMIAGYVGGKKARQTGSIFAAAVVPATIWTAGLFAVSQNEIKIAGQSIGLGPLSLLAVPTGASILGGALLAALPKTAKLVGAAISAGALGYLLFVGNQVRDLVKGITAGQVKYEPQKNKTCPENLKQLYAAVQFYADSWDDHLPPADRWMTAIKDNVPQDKWLHCPEVGDSPSKFGYSMNPALGGKKRSEIKDRAATPLFYDSADLAADAHAAPDSMPKPGRHGGKNNVVFADGSVKTQ